MKILFIDPTLSENERCNIGLGYLSGVLLNEGHDVKVINYANNMDWINSNIRDFHPDIIGFSIKSSVPYQAAEIADKMDRGKSYVICGGSHIIIDGYNFMKENPHFDLAACGESEDTILEIINFLNGTKRLEDIKGIVARTSDGELLVTESLGILKDLDRLPMPNYTTFDFYSPFPKLKRFDYFKDSIADYYMITSRGCPYKCTYCNAPQTLGHRWRVRSLDTIISEIRHVKKTYKNVDFINIADDNFTLDKKRAKKILREIIDKNLNIKWKLPNGVRADKLDDELVGLMKESGCVSIMLGVESGSPEVFNRIKKGETIEDVAAAAKLVKKYGIRLVGSFIIGLPYSNYKRDMETVRFAKRLQFDRTIFNLLVPYATTEAYRILVNDLDAKFLHDWRDTPIQFHDRKPFCAFETPDYLEKERILAYMKANLAFYNYDFIRNRYQSKLSPLRLLNLLWIVMRYDTVNLPNHLQRMGILFFRALKRRYRRLFLQAQTGIDDSNIRGDRVG